jgi:hypothetical protein
MGRNSTGVLTTGECKRIELSKLKKSGYLEKGNYSACQYAWTDGSTIVITFDTRNGNGHMRLQYVTTYKDGRKEEHDYKVRIVSVPSNLGKGEVLYFVCPVSSKLCRVLYKAYGCPIWKCRHAYQNRIYYQSQLSSHKDRYNDRYWAVEKKLEAQRAKRRTYTYKGKATKRAERIEKLIDAQTHWDRLRWSVAAMPVAMQKIFRKNGIIT